MRPSFSVIVFTSASGAGYGLFASLALFVAAGALPPGGGFSLSAVGLSHALIVGGLLASTFHLGRPERAWRALSQWRSSWLSREGVAALSGLVPSSLFAVLWGLYGREEGPTRFAGVAGAVFAAVTVLCTGMIYASLKPIPRWNHRLVPAIYLALAFATGTILLVALLRLFGIAGSLPGVLAAFAIALGWALKSSYWRDIDCRAPSSTLATATGLGASGPVRHFEAAQTGPNFVAQEMGYVLDAPTAQRVRRYIHVSLFLIPFTLTLAGLAAPPPVSTAAALGAVLSAAIGVGGERWLFFAEAAHVSRLYYRTES